MFIYYVPNLSADQLTADDKFNRDRLSPVLANVLADCEKVGTHVVLNPVRNGSGPGVTSGVVIAPLSKHYGSPIDKVYLPVKQDWFPVGKFEKPDYWIGVNKSQIPTPLHLERNRKVPGLTVTDDSGREWMIPVARSRNDKYGFLPQYYEFNDLTNAVESQLKPEQRPLWDLGNELWNWYNAESEAKSQAANDSPTKDDPDRSGTERPERPDFNWLARQALALLQVNYRIGAAELRMLRRLSGPVLAQETIFGVTQTAIGFDLIDEYTKKKPAESTPVVPSGSNSNPGESIPSDAPITGQATEPFG